MPKLAQTNECLHKPRRKAGFVFYNKKMEQKLLPDFKSVFLEKFEPEISSGAIKNICDLGSGLSLNFIPILEKYPNLRYVGVEPSEPHANRARRSLAKFPNAEIFCASGYLPVGTDWGTFDLVISLSVLEHVKQIERFIGNSAAAARRGGRVIHRWDLGHALYPSSFKEHMQVWIGDHLPVILPESKFVRTLMPSEVRNLMTSSNILIEDETYHQAPAHKAFLKGLEKKGVVAEAFVREMIEWEFKVSPLLDVFDEDERLKIFPTVTLWGRKV